VNKSTGDISTTFILTENESTLKVWPHKFTLTLTVLLKGTSLSMQLRVENRNEEAGKDFEFTTLLHTYFAVESIQKTTVRGLQGLKYVDQTEGNKVKEERPESIIFQGEVDRKYLDAGGRSITINDGGNCELVLKTNGFRDVVVWNAHVKKAASFTDMPPDGWQKYVCVEAGTVQEPVKLEPGKSWDAVQGISLQMTQDANSQIAQKVQQEKAGKL
jgi:glucose-6-phosphate 1-epimerase